ncbi:RNA polymerase sigma factor [Mucilaginibacter sp. AW1-3]
MHLPKGITEQELIQRCKNGDLKHLEMLYKHFYGYAMGIALRYSNNRDDALEVANDAFIKAFGALKNYDTDKSFKAWLRRIIVNTAIDKQRREQKHQSEEIDKAGYVASTPNIIEQLNANDILKLLAVLPVMHRTVFNLYEIDGYSHDEIATMLNIPASSSRVYLTRAKEKMRELLSK